MKKILIIIITLLLTVNLFAGDDEDFEYIQKLIGNKYYKEAVTELQTFMKKHINSRHYNDALNLLGASYYMLKKYNNAKTTFKLLTSTELKNNAYYYLTLIAAKQNKLKEADKNLNQIDELNKLKPDKKIAAIEKLEKMIRLDRGESTENIAVSIAFDLTGFK